MPKKAESIDRRILKTRLALRDALLALLARKSWDEINIQEICHQANVGRSTFYLRYQGKEDLLEESLNDLRDFLIANTGQSGNKEVTTLHGLLDHIAEQRAVFKAVMGRRGGQRIAARFKDMMRQLIELDLRRRSNSSAKHAWLSHYLTGGIYEMMAWWVDAVKQPSIAEMERRIDLLMRAALRIEF